MLQTVSSINNIYTNIIVGSSGMSGMTEKTENDWDDWKARTAIKLDD